MNDEKNTMIDKNNCYNDKKRKVWVDMVYVEDG